MNYHLTPMNQSKNLKKLDQSYKNKHIRYLSNSHKLKSNVYNGRDKGWIYIATQGHIWLRISNTMWSQIKFKIQIDLDQWIKVV